MDKNLLQLHKKIRELSPIHRSESKIMNNCLDNKKTDYENKLGKTGEKFRKVPNDKVGRTLNPKKSSNKLRNDDKQDMSPRTVDKDQSTDKLHKTEEKKRKKDKDAKLRFPKNINEYRHIMSNFQTVDAELAWILDLRTAQKMAYKGLKDVADMNPRFYSDRIVQFKKEIEQDREKKKKDASSPKGNSNVYRHLIKQRLGATANSSQFGFEINLRRPYDPSKTNSDWKGISFSHKPRLFSSYLPQVKKDKFELQMETKYSGFNNTLRAVEPVYDQIMVGNHVVKRKKMEPSKTTYSDFLGEHAGMDKYDYKYEEKNVNQIRHILAVHSNSAAQFEISLRNHSSYSKKRPGTTAIGLKLKSEKKLQDEGGKD